MGESKNFIEAAILPAPSGCQPQSGKSPREVHVHPGRAFVAHYSTTPQLHNPPPIMHTRTTQNQFLLLRARGWSLARIADHLKVSKTTLVDWNRELHWEIKSIRAVEREAVHDQLLASLKEDLARVSKQWKALEKEIARRKFDDVATDKLFHLTVLLRQQHEKLQERLESMEDRDLSIPLPMHPVAASYLDLAQFKETYGFPLVPPSPFDPKPEVDPEPDNSPLPDSPKADDPGSEPPCEPAKPENR